MSNTIIFYFSIIILCILYIKNLESFYSLLVTIKWLKSPQKKNRHYLNKELPFFFILLPVLREQKDLPLTIKNILNQDYPKNKYKIIIITTERENREKLQNRELVKKMAVDIYKKKTCQELINKYLNIFNETKIEEIYQKCYGLNFPSIYQRLKKEYENYPTTFQVAKKIYAKHKNILEIINYPYPNGYMAHQINYAVSKISDQNSYIAIYNADSSIPKKTLKTVSQIIYNQKKSNFVIQQSALFIKNLQEIRPILQAGGIFQSLWTLNQEIPRIHKQYLSCQKPSYANNRVKEFFNVKLAHCVGHGLFIKVQLFNKLHGLPITTLNEDVLFGFQLCALKIPIIPIKIMETATTPSTIKYLINQKRIWFWSYLEYIKFWKQIHNHTKINKNICNSLLLQGLLNGLEWLCSSFLFIIPLITGFTLKNILIILTDLTAIILFSILPAIQILKNLNFFKKQVGQFRYERSFISDIKILISCIFVNLTDSLGPVLAIFDYFKFIFTGAKPYKQKTER